MSKSKLPRVLTEFSDAEEKVLYEATEQGEFKSVGNLEERKDYWKQIAQNTISGKRTRISLAVPDRDLSRLKALALRKVVPFQTLINAVLHQYVKIKNS